MNRPPAELVDEGKLLPDLLYRLKGVPIALPPLRERESDVRLLAERFLAEACAPRGRSTRFTPNALKAIDRYSWPGNVRELRSVVEQAALFAEDGVLTPESLGIEDGIPSEEGEDDASECPASPLADAERAVILDSLGEEDGSVTHAARRLGISRATLYRKIRKLRARGRLSS